MLALRALQRTSLLPRAAEAVRVGGCSSQIANPLPRLGAVLGGGFAASQAARGFKTPAGWAGTAPLRSWASPLLGGSAPARALFPEAARAAALPARGQLLHVGGRLFSTTAAPALPTHPFVAGISESGRKQLVVWLGGASAWVFAMVVIGGVTRLTRSGLSMTEWKFTGEKRPQTDEDWAEEFEKYKKSPEFRRVNLSMTIDEFKFIFWMEYGHRMWGRALGLLFAGPCAYFAARGFITAPLARRLALLFTMGGAQGFVGWWMVKSGLEEPVNKWDVPRVSPYRLAAHLTSAFTIYSMLVWTTLSVAFPVSAVQAAAAAGGAGAAATLKAARALKGVVHPLSMLVGVTAISGAFVAGLQAGLAYNTFPDMNGQWIPDEYMAMTPWWKNLFESTATVQLDHRVLALTTLTAVTATWATAKRAQLPPATRAGLNVLLALTYGQVALGISTLLMHVPVSLGSAHQAGALTIFTVLLSVMHSLRMPAAVAAGAAAGGPVGAAAAGAAAGAAVAGATVAGA